MLEVVSMGTGSIEEIRLWKIHQGDLKEIENRKLDLEENLEEWIISDISIIAQNLLLIGRQVETDYGGVIDLLCLDENGDTVIIELKRDKTPREVTAQILDYASWTKNLTPDRLEEIASKYIRESSLEEAYQNKFNQELPESLNDEHKMLIVGTEIDGSSRRIINYLSEVYSMPINAVTFNYFKLEDEEYLARTFLIEKSRADASGQRISKRRPNLTNAQLQDIANENGVGEVYQYLSQELPRYFQGVRRTRSSLSLVGPFREIKRATIFNLIPGESDEENGLNWQVYDLRFREFFGITEEKALFILPSNKSPWQYGTTGDQVAYKESEVSEFWKGYTGYIKIDEAKKFIRALSELTKENTHR
jgi:uncharacterized protein YeaO (DUF488 family)